MMRKQSIACLLAAIFLLAPGIVLCQNVTQKGTLVVSGQSGQVPMIQVNGRSYVDLEGLVRAVNGSLSFRGDQTMLTLPGAATNTHPAATAPASGQRSNPGFSKGFLNAGIEQMATLREWHTALATAIQGGIPVTADRLAPYRAQADIGLRLASTAISTESDREVYQLLNNEFQNMDNLANKYIAKRANLTYISPDALKNDDLNQRIVACGHSLGSIAASGQFVDDFSCH